MPSFRTITVARLIELLEGESPDALVIFSTDYGDYHHTPQALPIEGVFDTATIEKSAYSNSGFAIVERDEDEPDDDEQLEDETFLVLR